MAIQMYTEQKQRIHKNTHNTNPASLSCWAGWRSISENTYSVCTIYAPPSAELRLSICQVAAPGPQSPQLLESRHTTPQGHRSTPLSQLTPNPTVSLASWSRLLRFPSSQLCCGLTYRDTAPPSSQATSQIHWLVQLDLHCGAHTLICIPTLAPDTLALHTRIPPKPGATPGVGTWFHSAGSPLSPAPRHMGPLSYGPSAAAGTRASLAPAPATTDAWAPMIHGATPVAAA